MFTNKLLLTVKGVTRMIVIRSTNTYLQINEQIKLHVIFIVNYANLSLNLATDSWYWESA